MGAVTLSLLSYGLTAVFSNNLGAAVSNICMGIFILLINVISAQGRAILSAVGGLFLKNVREADS